MPTLPPGFTLDQPKAALPQGFTLDPPVAGKGATGTFDQETPGFVKRVGEDISGRVQKVEEFAGRQKEQPIIGATQTAAIALGQTAGAIGDITAEALVSGFKTAVPEKAQETIKNTLLDFSQTRVGKLGMSALQKGQAAFDEYEKKFPDAALALGSFANLAGFGVATKGAKLTVKELANIGDDLATISGKVLPMSAEKAIKSKTREGIAKAIRPSVVKGKTAVQANQFFDKANEAVQTIIENKKILKLTDKAGDIVRGLPINLRQFTEAISNTKKELFQQYDEIAKISGQRGAEVDLSGIAKELDVIINNRGIQATSPDIADYAQRTKDNLSNISTLSAQEAQDAIASLNNKLSAITDFNSAAKASVDSLVANKLRADLNKVIEKTTGKQYNELKRKYGSLKEIEREVNRRAMVDARKNIRGLIDFTDVFTGGEVVRGIVSMNPASISAGLFGKAVAMYTKALNDPNRIVKKMFTDVDKILENTKKIKEPFSPKSGVLRKTIDDKMVVTSKGAK